MKNLLLGVLLTITVLVIAALAIIYTGGYNIAATEEHASVTRWAFESTMHESVERRAADIEEPETYTAEMMASGAAHYKQMCEHCHGGPDVQRAEWAEGMRPLPPLMTEAATEWEPHQIFWIVKHGIKMTGMPAFGPTHGDRELWNVVTLVRELPAMPPERYAALGGGHHAEQGAGSPPHHSQSSHSESHH